ncbi:hepatoma-derived growth factor-related protein 2-like [Teleopsis dalmanni]|uniref:hepatoma-derived growth factor-related protein 2-like n=1 Tax=Teleopsis dalmanni TaxID=139649 RepID=UPI0018CCB6F9|nr:hepatoma-derived growth factor-related protein 2-like [Teleopsis dalmanni]
MGKPKVVFAIGDLVFAKVRGYPTWPAKITSHKNGVYIVIFYGTGDEGHIKRQNLFQYTEKAKKKFSTARALKDPAFRKGIEEVEAALKDVHPDPIRGDDIADDTQPDDNVAAINTYAGGDEEQMTAGESVNTSETVEVNEENMRVAIRVDEEKSSQPKDYPNVTCIRRPITPEHYVDKKECLATGQEDNVISVEGECSKNIDANKPKTIIPPNTTQLKLNKVPFTRIPPYIINYMQ